MGPEGKCLAYLSLKDFGFDVYQDVITGHLVLDLLGRFSYSQIKAYRRAMTAYYCYSRVAQERHGYSFVDFDREYGRVNRSIFQWPVDPSARNEPMTNISTRRILVLARHAC